jgi:OmpA-OmpF porin, OOP family
MKKMNHPFSSLAGSLALSVAAAALLSACGLFDRGPAVQAGAAASGANAATSTAPAAVAGAAAAPSATLLPQAERISDQAIAADQRTYQTMQGRIKALNDSGRPVRDYHLSKAQCWLDVSFHEYTRNDRSAFPQAALDESRKLVAALEQNQTPAMDTPLVNGAAPLRPDLWERASALRGHRGFQCAQQKVACAEVELVHAGNEYNQQQWRHAKPYVQIAEDLLGEARLLAASCLPPPAPVVAIPAAPVAPVTPPPPVAGPVVAPISIAPQPAPKPVVQPLQLRSQVLFDFDKADTRNMRANTVAELRQMVAKIKADGLVVQSVRLAGYADRMKTAVATDYNLRLSERRVNTVAAELKRLGIDAGLITVAAGGDSQQVVDCSAQKFKRKADLEECLLPNRRVEVLVDAVRP